jgi:hypothetical protein
MKKYSLFILLILFWVIPAQAVSYGEAVEVRIVTDDGRPLPTYPVKLNQGVRKVYAEAVKGDHYRIEVRNLINRRVGLVIAVDGRNIISGTKSWLKNNERMYILEPYESGSFAGWRTAQDRINRFYFTDSPDSYASAFGDHSAMGVIAVAVYPEIIRVDPPVSLNRMSPSMPLGKDGKGDGQADQPRALPSAPPAAGKVMEKKAARAEQALESAGTGYGREEYSLSRTVAFDPEKRPMETLYFKYEWRSTLCKLGVIRCAPFPGRQPNRLWEDNEYAPPPPVVWKR